MVAQNSVRTRRGPGRPFRKGQSGNPGGRPKTRGLIEEIKRACGENGSKLIRAILAIADDQAAPASTRLAALELLLAYGWGQPAPMSEPTSTELPVKRVIFGGRYAPDGTFLTPEEDTVVGTRPAKQ